MKITAVVVTYNRLELLKECIAHLKQQTVPLDEIIIVNNDSTDGTDIWLSEQFGFTVINQENLGGAGGQYIGIKNAVANGADWIWCMDDDAMPYPDALEKLLPYCDDTKVAALACSVIDNSGKVAFVHRGYFDYKSLSKDFGCKPIAAERYTDRSVELGYATFVGIMISAKAIAKAGLPKKELFLHFDDLEYSLRLGNYGKILLIPASKILHKENASNHFFISRIWGKDRVRIKYDKLWLRYYVIRNVTWGIKEYYGTKWDASFVLYWYYLRTIIGIILFDDHKRKRIRFFTSAFKDGLSARFINGYDYINDKTRLY